MKAKGLRFLTSGYEITGDTLTLDNIKGNTPKIKVVGAGSQATISSVLAGVQGMNKLGEGTLILTGTNTYTGDTTISEGTLQLGNAGRPAPSWAKSTSTAHWSWTGRTISPTPPTQPARAVL